MNWFQLNLTAAWNFLQEIVNPTRRREERQRYHEMADGELTRRREDEASITTNLRQLERHPGNEAGTDVQRIGLAIIASLLIVVDVPVQFVINKAFMPLVPSVLWGISAPCLALGIAALVHGAIVAFAADHDRPARSIRIARTIAWATFLLALASALILLLARIAGPSMAAKLEDPASVALFGAAEGFALAGGAFSAWLHFLAVPVLQKRRLNATQSRIRDLLKFIDRLDNDDDSGPAPVGAH